MEAICKNCGKQYQSERETSKFCSNACRSKSHKKKKAALPSTSASGVLIDEQPWVPTQRERVLNKALMDSDFNIFRMQCIAEKMESSALVDEMIAIATQANHVTFHNEVRQEVDGFDMLQQMDDWDSFEARTGMVMAHKKKPL